MGYVQTDRSMVKYASDLYLKVAGIDDPSPARRVEVQGPTVSQLSNKGEVTMLTPEQEASLNAAIIAAKSKVRQAKKAGLYYDGMEYDLMKEAGIAGFLGNVASRASNFLGRAAGSLKKKEDINQMTKAIKSVSKGNVNRSSGAMARSGVVHPSRLPAQNKPSFNMGAPSKSERDAFSNRHLKGLNEWAASQPKATAGGSSGRITSMEELHGMADSFSRGRARVGAR